MNIIKIIIKYTVIFIPVGIILAILSGLETGPPSWIMSIVYVLGLVIVYFMFIEIGSLLKCDHTRKLYNIATRIIFGMIIIFAIIVGALGTESNSYLLSIGGFYVVFFSLTVISFLIAKHVKKTNELGGCLLYFIPLVLMLMIIIGIILHASGIPPG